MTHEEFMRAAFGQIFGAAMPAGINGQTTRPAPKQLNPAVRERLEQADAALRQRIANRDQKFSHAR